MRDGMRNLGPPARLQVRQQLEPPGVIRPVVHPAQRHDAVGVIAAAERARRQVGGREPLERLGERGEYDADRLVVDPPPGRDRGALHELGKTGLRVG